MAELYGGVETGGTWCVCVLGRGLGEIEAETQFPTTEPEQTLGRITAFFESHPRPAAVGIGSFGPAELDPASPRWGSVTTTPKPGWRHTSVAGVLRDRLRVPVAFDTDVNAAALGEIEWGAGRGAESLCYITVGTGIGAGLVIDGRPWHGLLHPEAGHMRLPHDLARDPFAGSCPVHGDCWEGLASGRAIAERWGAEASRLPDDHPAWELEAEYLALGLLSVVSVISPHLIVLGGGVMEHPGMIELVRAHLTELVGGYLDLPALGTGIDSYVVAPGLGDRAGVLGAILLARRLRA